MQLKCMVLPVAGAVLGGAVGGPVGIVAGLKAAKLAAFSGGILGMLSDMTTKHMHKIISISVFRTNVSQPFSLDFNYYFLLLPLMAIFM